MATSRRRKDATTRVAVFLVTCLLVSLGANLMFLLVADDSTNLHSRHFQTAASLKQQLVKQEVVEPQEQEFVPDTTTTTTHQRINSRLAKLSCAAHGGPSDEIAAEMIYWRDIPSDAAYVSPMYDESANEKYLLWDVDVAGFNNKRLSFENFVLLAHAMGRTLVMPAKGIWWGFSLNQNKTRDAGKHPNRWEMGDFYDVEQMAAEQAGFKVISMEEFLKQHAMTGKLANERKQPQFPPDNRTDWNNLVHKKLKKYLGRVTTHITWRPEDCIGAFPSANTDQNRHNMEDVRREILKNHGPPGPANWIGHPTPVDANVHDRMEEIMTDRKNLCLYTPEQQQDTYLYYKILYDPTNYTLSFEINIRLLIYFYCFIFFEDWHQDLWAKRFIRDHFRYKDELHCAAARIVDALRQTSADGDFDVLHIRRNGDFEDQYGDLTSADDIIKTIQSEISKNRTVYIATDELNKTFFQPIEDYFDNKIWYLDDFRHLIPGINVNYYSIIDQLVSTRGHTFFGAFCSTFSGYINRLRGYHSTKSKWDGYQDGALLDSFFYNFNVEGRRDKMRSYHPPVKSWFFREFPLAWRDIDHDLEDADFVG
jgi:hypothetical protein